MTQADRITKARMHIILRSPFWGTLLLRLRMVRDDSQQTFCTDGRLIAYNEAFAAALTDDELRGVLAHEVAHCALGHLWRMGARHPVKWNFACDFAINALLTDFASDPAKNGGGAPWKLPAGGLLDPKFAGMASEDIYNQLPDVKTLKITIGCGGGKGEGASSPGEFTAPGALSDKKGQGKDGMDGKGQSPLSPADAKTLEDDWKVAVTQAATVQRMQGRLPGCLARLVDELLEPRVPWRQVLREFIRERARDDYSWAHPNRRHLQRGFCLPTLHSERMGRIVCAVDTSGSIGQRELAEFQAEIQAALDECKPECIEVLYADAAIAGREEFSPGDAVRLDAKGGGGTDFRPVFSDIAEKQDDPACLIYLTDGYGTFPPSAPEYPVLWASNASPAEHYPFGQVVSIK